MKNKEKIGIIGAGKMGGALIAGLMRAGFSPENIMTYDPDSFQLLKLHKEYKIKLRKNNQELVKEADIIILAVKPQVMGEVLKEIAPWVKERKPLVISIAAGIKIKTIQRVLGKEVKLVRVMPNTPGLIGEGISAYFTGSKLEKEDKEKVEVILSALGKVVEVEKEELMDAVTGLSGSGPAYIFVIIEALADAGVKMGLNRKLAMELAVQTVIGAGKMVFKTGKHPGELKDMVTSPGGTTIAGLSVLEQGGLRGLLIKAVESATLRSKELGGGLKKRKRSKRRKR